MKYTQSGVPKANPIANLPVHTIAEALLDPKRSRYLNGLCFELADALHRRYGYSFGAVWRDEPDDLADYDDEVGLMSSIVHVFVVDETGNALDACGQRSLPSFTRDWEQQPSARGVYRVQVPISRLEIAAEIGEPEVDVDLADLMGLSDAADSTLEL